MAKKIIVDAFGGDNAPDEIIKGCRMAADELGVEIILTGREDEIRKAAARLEVNISDFEIVDCPDIVTMDDEATDVARRLKNSSMAVGMRMLREGKGDAFASAGNSGAMVAGATLLVQRIKGIKRVGFAPMLPNMNGFFMLCDSGANVECTPDMLEQFGLMGSVYMKKVMGIENPRVCLLNNGTEVHKGTEVHREAYTLLSQREDINFVGNMEGRDIPVDGADVVVCDGFSGNIFLKTYEGVAMALMDKIKGVMTMNLKNKLAAAVVYKDMKALKKSMDYNEYGGAPILGCTKPVFKVHGSAKAKTLKSAIALCAKYAETGIIEEIAAAVQKKEDQ